MAKSRDNIRIYGDDNSGVFVAAVGVAAPIGFAVPGVGFTELGWLSEDGVDLDRKEDVAEFKAWQGGTLVRKKTTSVDDTFKFQCLEEQAVTLGLYYKGAVATAGSGFATYAITNQSVSDERSWLIDFKDDAHSKRYLIPTGEVTERAEIPHKNSDLTLYEFTVSIYGDYSVIVTADA